MGKTPRPYAANDILNLALGRGSVKLATQESFRLFQLSFSPVLSFRPARLINIWTILIADPIPPGDIFGFSMIRATSSPGLVKVPAGGKVDSVLISRDHFRFLVLAVSLRLHNLIILMTCFIGLTD